MSQITELFAQTMLKHCDQGQHPPLTVWEAKQFIWAWLELQELRKSQVEPVGVVGPMPGASGFTIASFEANKVPVGTNLYTSAPTIPAPLEYSKHKGPQDYVDGWNDCRDAMLAQQKESE